jgi:hypothetical protein
MAVLFCGLIVASAGLGIVLASGRSPATVWPLAGVVVADLGRLSPAYGVRRFSRACGRSGRCGLPRFKPPCECSSVLANS